MMKNAFELVNNEKDFKDKKNEKGNFLEFIKFS